MRLLPVIMIKMDRIYCWGEKSRMAAKVSAISLVHKASAVSASAAALVCTQKDEEKGRATLTQDDPT